MVWIYDIIRDFIVSLWKPERAGFWAVLAGVCKVMVALALLCWAILKLLYGIADIPSALEGLADTIDGLTSMVHTLPASPYIAKINRIFPLSEALGFVAAIFTLRIIGLGIRVARSFLPGIGG